MWLRLSSVTPSQMRPPQKATIMIIIGIHPQLPLPIPSFQLPLCMMHLHDNPGQWMLHCHNTYHLETGMATVFSYLA